VIVYFDVPGRVSDPPDVRVAEQRR